MLSLNLAPLEMGYMERQVTSQAIELCTYFDDNAYSFIFHVFCVWHFSFAFHLFF